MTTPPTTLKRLSASEQRTLVRILPLLPTHLSLGEIAHQLVLSRNTVKTQVAAIYRKLDATSRTEAVQRASDLGLLDH